MNFNKTKGSAKIGTFKILIKSTEIDKDIKIPDKIEKGEPNPEIEQNKSETSKNEGETLKSDLETQKSDLAAPKSDLEASKSVSAEDSKPTIPTEDVASKVAAASESSEESEYDSETESKSKKNSSEAEQSSYDPSNVHYEGELAVYTDPKSGYQYSWDKSSNEWKPKENIQYGFEDDTHTYTDKDGIKYFWDKDKSAWFPKIDDDFMAQYQLNYGFVDNTSEKTEEVVPKIPEAPKVEKVVDKGVKRKAQVDPTWFDVKDEENRNVYVSNLPTDITEEEFVDLMQKCGLVMRDLNTGKMKVKLYSVPDTDILKGDALCTYIKLESVELALNILDGYLYKGKRIKVERAKFQMKGNYNPSLKPKKKKKKEQERLRKMQEKLFDWRPDKLRGERSKHERVVIVKNVFEPSIFDKDVGLILEYQQDLREECSKCGEVRKVILYDRHPEGVAQINMKDPEQADEVVKLLNGRWFGQRQLTCEIWDGKTKFKIAETDAQISKRIDEWDKFLEDDSKKTDESKKQENIKSEESITKTDDSKTITESPKADEFEKNTVIVEPEKVASSLEQETNSEINSTLTKEEK